MFHVTIFVVNFAFESLGTCIEKARPEYQSELILSLKTIRLKCEWCIWVTHMKSMASCNKGIYPSAHGPLTLAFWQFMLELCILTVSF